MGLKEFFRKEPNELEREVAGLVEVLVGLADFTEEKVRALLGEVPPEVSTRLDRVRSAGAVFFAAYENREWGNLKRYNDLVNRCSEDVQNYLVESGISERLQADSD